MPGTFQPPTISGAIKRLTVNFNLAVPYFDAPGWGTALERNLDSLDAILYAATGLTGILGPWDNSTAYIEGNRVIDVDADTVYQCLVSHTSASSGSFADDRIANPTYWSLITTGVVVRGEWADATQYNTGEIITDSGRTGVAATSFVSDSSYDDDVSDGNITTIVDVSAFQSWEVATHAATEKATLADNDEFSVVDTAAGNSFKKHKWSSIKSFISSMYQPLATVLTNTTAAFTTTLKTKLDGIEEAADVTDTGNVYPIVQGVSSKASVVDDDQAIILDSAASSVPKRITFAVIKTWILAFISSSLNPAGVISPYGGSTAPTGWLECDGSAVSRSTYSALFTAIGTTWGAGNGSTTFNLPDFRGEFVRGWDHSRGVDTGRAIGSSQTDLVKDHTHPASASTQASHDHNIRATDPGFAAAGNYISCSSNNVDAHNIDTDNANSHTHTITVSSNTGGGAENRPRNVAAMYIIKT